MIHLVCGSTGAGKTTYARRLADEIGGLRFSVDEWMSALFWADAPTGPDPAWAIERINRCVGMIWATALDAARRGTPAVLEIGLTTRAARAAAAERAEAEGLTYRLYYLDVDAAERWRRVLARNEDAGGSAQLGFAITREMFDFVEGMWEAPDDAELERLHGVRIDGHAGLRA